MDITTPQGIFFSIGLVLLGAIASPIVAGIYSRATSKPKVRATQRSYVFEGRVFESILDYRYRKNVRTETGEDGSDKALSTKDLQKLVLGFSAGLRANFAVTTYDIRNSGNDHLTLTCYFNAEGRLLANVEDKIQKEQRLEFELLAGKSFTFTFVRETSSLGSDDVWFDHHLDDVVFSVGGRKIPCQPIPKWNLRNAPSELKFFANRIWLLNFLIGISVVWFISNIVGLGLSLAPDRDPISSEPKSIAAEAGAQEAEKTETAPR